LGFSYLPEKALDRTAVDIPPNGDTGCGKKSWQTILAGRFSSPNADRRTRSAGLIEEMTSANSVLNFTDADLRASMRRAMLFTLVCAVAGFVLLSFSLGWQTGALFVAGAVVSVTGLYEWQQLIGIINAKLDQQATPRSSGFVLAMFFLRLGIAGLIIYASLRCFHGSLYALLAGLGLAIVALTVEAVRMVRS
jgi:hypothetical protein